MHVIELNNMWDLLRWVHDECYESPKDTANSYGKQKPVPKP